MQEDIYKKIMEYFDREFFGDKTTYTGWNYYGLILDYYFENSVLQIDYLGIEQFFLENGGFNYVEDKSLEDQYCQIAENRRLKLTENILNILKHSSYNEKKSVHIVERVTNVLTRYGIKVSNIGSGYIQLSENNIFDSGSYCNIIKVKEGVLKKELKSEYQKDVSLNKRLKYEYENMQKLSDCPQVLNVYDFDGEKNSYLMEQADKNLYVHLKDEIELAFEERFKIISDILKGMEVAHDSSIIHRDLHLGNILKIGRDFVISDFGLSKDLSIERSLKSSISEKNNHIFVDPSAGQDFSKLDEKSDIYSIGKLIDYILTYNSPDYNHILKTVVEKCICRDKSLRYDSVSKIINDIEFVLKEQSLGEDKQAIINKVLNNQYDISVHDFIMDLVHSEKLSKFIVKHRLSSFGDLLLCFEDVYQVEILKCISSTYSEATGYGGWANYDIFANISHYICLNASDLSVKGVSKEILEGCAGIRYSAKDLLDSIL